MGRLRVNIEEVEAMLEFRSRVNSALLPDIDWYRDGEKIDASKAGVEDWFHSGLNNLDFYFVRIRKP